MSAQESTSLGERIRALQEERGVSLSQLARDAGVAKGYLWQLLRGEATNPGLDTLTRIASALDVPVVKLVWGVDAPEEESDPRSEGTPGDLPPALEEFIERARERGTPLSRQDIDMLRGIRHRGRRPQTADDFALLYDMVRRIVD